MEIEQFLHGIRWDIISTLAQSPKSPSQIAQELSTSVPNVSQQLRLMELSGLVQKERVKSKSLNMPRVQYSLKMPLHFVASCNMGGSYKEIYTEDVCMRSLVFALLGAKRKGVFEVLLKFLTDNYEIFEHAKCVAISGTSQGSIDILVITEKHLGKLRGELANQIVKACGFSFKVALWSHTEDEFKQGVLSKEEYFTNFMKKKLVNLVDKGRVVENIREDTHE